MPKHINLTEQPDGSFDLPTVGDPHEAVWFVHGDVNYPPNIGAEHMREHGKMMFEETPYDEENRISTGFSEAIVGDKVVWTHTTVFKPLADVKQRRIDEIYDKMNNVSGAGIIVTVGGNDFNFRSRPEDIDRRNAIVSALSLGETYPAGGIPVWTIDGTKLKATEAQFTLLIKAQAAHLVAAAARAEVLIDEINALGGVQAVIDHDISTGWPVNP